MLVSLRIDNFALVDYLELEVGQGLNVLTGETGAGKSIILDAIDVVLGGKASSRTIRSGSKRAIVEATFQVNPTLAEWLEQQEIELLEEEYLVCSRELNLGKGNLRSRCRVNGVLVNRQLIGGIRDRLVEITAQGQTIQLMIPEQQRELLDLYGGKSLLEQREKVAAAYSIYQKTKQDLAKRIQSEEERIKRLDLLEFKLKELREAEIVDPEELEQLEQERDRLLHVVELQQLSYQVYQLLYQSDTEAPAAGDVLAQAESCLTEMVEYDSEIETILEMIQSALTQVIEAGQQINRYGEGLEADPQRLAEVEERVRLLKGICRKYGLNLAEAIALRDNLEQELAEVQDSNQTLQILQQEYQKSQTNLESACNLLTQLRQKAGKKLANQLVKELKPLAMEKVVFECRFTSIPATNTGSDRVDFYISPNAGEELQPLASIASGGEMSRFLLALKACFSQAEKTSNILIFDEIDAGVSGKVAQAIAAKLRQLSQQHQVLCVTHQPLVAAMADHHFCVEKTIIEETNKTRKESNGDSHLPDIRTVVRVKLLDNLPLRREELAQLTGGHSAEEAIAFAESLLVKAAASRNVNFAPEDKSKTSTEESESGKSQRREAARKKEGGRRKEET
jgi:DNA repair protein RecN (Recombination protein N)